MGLIFKQPNGLYGRWSSIMDNVSDIDMTKQDYIDMCVEKAIDKATEDAKWVLEKRVLEYSDIQEQAKTYDVDIDKEIDKLRNDNNG